MLSELIRSGCFSRRQSIDLLDGLDFDFLNGLQTEEDVSRVFEEDFMYEGIDLTSLTHPLNLNLTSSSSNVPLLPLSFGQSSSFDDCITDSFKNPLLFFPHFSTHRPSFDNSSFQVSQYEEDIDFEAADDEICSSFIQDVFSMTHHNTDNLVLPDDFSDRFGQHPLHLSTSADAGGGSDVELSAYEKLAATLQQQQQQQQQQPNGWLQVVDQSLQDEDRRLQAKRSGTSHIEAATPSPSLPNLHLLSPSLLPPLSFPDHFQSIAGIKQQQQQQLQLQQGVECGLMFGGEGFVGAYSPEQRKLRIEKFFQKRTKRVWTKKVKYDVRKNFADSRVRVKGRFVKKEEEEVPSSSSVCQQDSIGSGGFVKEEVS